MFFSEDEPEAGTSALRYDLRLSAFKTDSAPLPSVRHSAYWILHNCVAHPLLALSPTLKAVEFHDLTSSWLNKEMSSGRRSTVPKKMNRAWWTVHNLVVHPLIGLFPIRRFFELHDATALKMGVRGWL